jgi:DNA-binding HxlR family transcriptional regulator
VRVSYALTEAGAELEPVLVSLGRWAERWVDA